MHLVMFDIDGTLVNTDSFEDACFIQAIKSVLDIDFNQNWSLFPHVSDTGIVTELTRNIKDDVKRQSVFQEIRSHFFNHIESHLRANPVPEITGANSFLARLKSREDVTIAIATGGWKHTAELKLASAGIDVSGMAIATSDDHFDRTEIMRIAESRASATACQSKTYFGDAAWDKAACEKLGYNFVLVGSKIAHYQRIDDFQDIKRMESYIGLPFN